MITKIWYIVINDGDGSTYPAFFDSEELAKLEEEYVYGAWAAPSIDSITIEHEGEIKISGIDINTLESTKEELEKYKRHDDEIPKYEELLKMIEERRNNNV